MLFNYKVKCSTNKAVVPGTVVCQLSEQHSRQLGGTVKWWREHGHIKSGCKGVHNMTTLQHLSILVLICPFEQCACESINIRCNHQDWAHICLIRTDVCVLIKWTLSQKGVLVQTLVRWQHWFSAEWFSAVFAELVGANATGGVEVWKAVPCLSFKVNNSNWRKKARCGVLLDQRIRTVATC